MSDHEREWFARLERNSIRAAEAKFGVDHPRHDWPVSEAEREGHALRRILLDLIAELRASHHPYTELFEGEDPWCVGCAVGWDGENFEVVRWPCETAKGLDRAEARLTLQTAGRLAGVALIEEDGSAVPFVAVGNDELTADVDEAAYQAWLIEHDVSGDDDSCRTLYRVMTRNEVTGDE